MPPMDSGLELSPLPLNRRRSSVLDVLLVFAGANIVTTTLVTGGSIGTSFSLADGAALVFIGTLVGTGILALLSRLGPRFGVPSMVLLRQPFGDRGSQAISLLLVLTNFAWIALNNVIAGKALANLAGGEEWLWSVAVGAAAVALTLYGPRAMALFNRFAVPLLVVVGIALTVALSTAENRSRLTLPGTGSLSWLGGLDLVIGYQVSWSLMFADYTRFQRRESRAALAVFLGMTLSSMWLMTLGAAAGKIGGANDPTAMILGVGLPIAALLLMALSTITTNFVNLYLSSLAVRNLWSAAPAARTVLTLGAIGTALGLASPNLLDSYAGFMGWIGSSFLPIVAIVIVHFFSVHREPDLPATRTGSIAAMAAWAAGVATYQLALHVYSNWGATLPTLLVSGLCYRILCRPSRD